MTAELLLFYAFGGLALLSAVGMLVNVRNTVNAALCLMVSMVAIAALFVLLHAEFLGVLQVLVYAGAIVVLFVFVIMLLNAGEEEKTRGNKVALALGVPGLIAFFILICWTVSAARSQLGRVSIGDFYVPTQQLGIALFREFLLPFEVTSVLVLIAIMGAVVLARRERQ